jgi:hypothetical protein
MGQGAVQDVMECPVRDILDRTSHMEELDRSEIIAKRPSREWVMDFDRSRRGTVRRSLLALLAKLSDDLVDLGADLAQIALTGFDHVDQQLVRHRLDHSTVLQSLLHQPQNR